MQTQKERKSTINAMKKLLFIGIILVSCSALSAHAQQTVWHNPLDQSLAVVNGQGFEGLGDYSRLPSSAQPKIRSAVWDLSRNSAGITVRFRTDAPRIQVRYTVTGSHAMPHMPATGVTGLDLYATTPTGEIRWVKGNYSFADTIRYNYNDLTYDPAPTGQGYEYELYLPLYNTVKWLEIGVAEGARFSFVERDSRPPIVAYGTSIMQGACASRPGMSWTGIVKREMGVPMVNLGFSGNGRLEREVVELIAQIPASVYILDCMPNCCSYFTSDTTYARTIATVEQLRAAHPNTPILLVDHSGYPGSGMKASDRKVFESANAANLRAYDELRKRGVKELYYLSYKDISLAMDAMVDGVHPTDYGMVEYARAYKKILNTILRKNKK